MKPCLRAETESGGSSGRNVDIYLGRERRHILLKPSESSTAQIGQPHTFANQANKPSVTTVETRPAGGVVKAFQLAYAVANDGGAAKDGLPKNPLVRLLFIRFLNEIRSQFTGFSSIQDFGYTTDGTRTIEELFGEKVIQFPKPVEVPKMLCEQTTSSAGGDIVMDFFAGSCTTAQAVLELNRADG